jgi:hypothetical protein
MTAGSTLEDGRIGDIEFTYEVPPSIVFVDNDGDGDSDGASTSATRRLRLGGAFFLDYEAQVADMTRGRRVCREQCARELARNPDRDNEAGDDAFDDGDADRDSDFECDEVLHLLANESPDDAFFACHHLMPAQLARLCHGDVVRNHEYRGVGMHVVEIDGDGTKWLRSFAGEYGYVLPRRWRALAATHFAGRFDADDERRERQIARETRAAARRRRKRRRRLIKQHDGGGESDDDDDDDDDEVEEEEESDDDS